MKVQLILKSRTGKLLLVLPLFGAMLFSVGYLQVPTSRSTTCGNKVHVLLLSSWRSGSSFVGQAFNQHPDVFYLMEPGWHLWKTMQSPGMRSMRMALRDLMRSLFQCDFSVMESYLQGLQKVSSLFMWSQSRALCSPPACSLTSRGQISNQTICYEKCNGRDLKGAQQACSTYSHVVIKEVRFFELESLFPVLQDPSLDLRIVHLVRDPRAVASSRRESLRMLTRDTSIVLEQRKIPKDQVEFHMMEELCRSHIRINERATVDPPPLLKGRYRMVRYEDVVQNPLKEIASLYDFVGLQMTRQLGEWIYGITHGQDTYSSKDTFKVTSRDAISVAHAWHTKLPHNTVKLIQQVCREAMFLTGYKLVDSEEEQKRSGMDIAGSPDTQYQFDWLPTL